MGWIEYFVHIKSEQNICQLGNTNTSKYTDTTVDSSPLKFRYSRD